MSIVFRKIKILPFGSRYSTGYGIRQLILFWFKKMSHVYVASGSPVGCCYMTKSDIYEHQSALSVMKSADLFCSTFDLAVELLNLIIVSNPCTMLRGKIHIGQGFFNSVFHFFSTLANFIKRRFSATLIAF